MSPRATTLGRGGSGAALVSANFEFSFIGIAFDFDSRISDSYLTNFCWTRVRCTDLRRPLPCVVATDVVAHCGSYARLGGFRWKTGIMECWNSQIGMTEYWNTEWTSPFRLSNIQFELRLGVLARLPNFADFYSRFSILIKTGAITLLLDQSPIYSPAALY